jgi:putative serine protease PepD
MTPGFDRSEPRHVAPVSVYPASGMPYYPPPVPAWGPPVAPPPPRRRSPLALILVAVLAVVAGVQAYFLVDLNGRLARADRQRASDGAAAARQQDALAGRIKALEQRAAASLDSAAVASAVLPSVFRVDAGNFSGTAFAMGKAGSGSDLLTNYHVVADLYKTGGRSVSLQHDSQRYPARIVRVDPGHDLALLHATATFPRLAAAGKQVASGVPIIVVGAPLGLAQSVTSGIVSAVRSDVPGEAGKTFIQFSAPINPGNSGGPVVDAQKQVVGIASAKANDAEGIGLAIPIHVACDSFTVC